MNDRDSVWLDISSTELEDSKNPILYVYQVIRLFSNNCDQKNVKQIRKLVTSYPEHLNIPIDSITEDILSKPETRTKFKNDVIDKLLEKTYNECQTDNNELLFFAAATFNLTRLQEVITQLKTNGENLNQTRYSDSVITFVIKYANLRNKNFFKCLQILLDDGVDVNVFDIRGKTAIDYVAAMYECYKHDQSMSKKIKDIAQLFLNTGIVKAENKQTMDFLTKEMNVDEENYKFKAINEESMLFYYLIKNKTEEFLAFKNIRKFVNANNSENTLLQLASKRTENLLPIVQFLLKNDANPNLTTKCNPYTPLELAAKNNNQRIFEELLKHKNTEITYQHYNNFVKWRSRPMKVRLFEQFLESTKLDPSFTYEKTGNTPLHYAVTFSHKKAIQSLLKRHSSLIVKNKCDLSVLDIIDAEDLEKYFDTCLALDNYSAYFSDINYKMKFRFNCLVDKEASREVKVVSKIGNHPNLEHLLIHPFVHTFLTLKWFQIKIYFWFILTFQAFLFLFLSVGFYHLSQSFSFGCCIFFSILNTIIKTPIFLFFKIKKRRPKFFALNRATLHGFLELFLIITTVGSFFQNQFRAFVFVEMAISFLLTAGYHPTLSKWSLMLQRVFKTFTVLLMFFSLIVVAFSVGFKVLFPDDEFFKNFLTAIFRTYIMTTGEFNIEEDTGFDTAGFGGYLLFLLFAMSMSLVIVNFWTGVAVTDIERIEKNSEINASKNVIIFMLFIDYFYTLECLAKIRNYIPNTLLFLKIDKHGNIFHNPDQCQVDFYVNKQRQFSEENFPNKLDSDCFHKIKFHYYKLKSTSSENVILTKLEELTKIVTEIKTKYMQNNNKSDGSSFDSKPRKLYRNKKQLDK